MLLSGPPGTGKTLLARAVAGEAGVPFFSASASEFVEMIVGVGASRVRDLFAQAKAAQPAIVFIDELDAIGRARGGGANLGGHDEREQTLNQILTEMDGFSPNSGVIVLAATNRPDVLDKALLRPGRFDRRVVVQPPDRQGRLEILQVHTRSVPLAPDVDLGSIASTTPGMVGADLANLVNEAALLAARRSHKTVEMADFTDAVEKIVLGRRAARDDDAGRPRRTAYHEAGHALVGMLTPGADPVRKVSIIPRGMALGVTFSSPDADRFNYDEAYLKGRLRVALGGRVAEEIVYDSITSGAESDLQQVTAIARQMVGRWGMSPAIGPVAVLPSEGDGPLLPGVSETSELTQQTVDAEVRRLADEAHADALELLTRERARLDALAHALLEAETLDEEAAYAAAGVPHTPATPDACRDCPAPGRLGSPGDKGRDDMTELWRGFANMAATAGREVVIAKGRGSTVWDDKGKAYLDSTASLWYMNVGYGRDEIADAVGAQLKELAAFHTFGPFANPPLLKLADKVAELSRDGRRRGLLHLRRRLRRRRHRGQARAPLLERDRPPREADHHLARARLPRHQRVRHEPAGHPGQPHGLRRPDAAHREHPVGRRRRARGAARRPRRPHRRLHRRAGDRRRRRDPAARGLLAARAGALPQARRAADLGRGHLRLRPPRQRTSAASASASRPIS